MAGFIKGDAVVIPFPFSDLTQSKRRPAIVLATLDSDDIILCQVTSQRIRDKYAIPIDDSNFESGSLKRNSNIRPNRIFTADRHIILYKIGHLKPKTTDKTIDKVIGILKEK